MGVLVTRVVSLWLRCCPSLSTWCVRPQQEYTLVFSWLRTHFNTLVALATTSIDEQRVLVPLLRLVSELCHKRVARIPVDAWGAIPYVLFDFATTIVVKVGSALQAGQRLPPRGVCGEWGSSEGTNKHVVPQLQARP